MLDCDWSSDVCSSDLAAGANVLVAGNAVFKAPDYAQAIAALRPRAG
jgi:pentose-5-phosphate-3-epimerase